ncbi:Pycsar system effector family protein [Abyssalbus ytuae]|uniref:DUF5706 domain-containing protein n=1 Tax=Abyssalbus ytuae TaxID=2926907 RepID=A0A9E6ZL84_9FLAO|nr:Pycsar system effector family protein [Abyssalbus ytuae]UOB16310.1 DUF5706 domain-containing protein [Abyssalbus ytuae]
MSDIINKAEMYVSNLLSKELDRNYLYHNLRHTQRVVKSTKELIENCKIDNKQKEILMLAAWFHDTGYIKGCEKHEEKSCEIVKQFLKENQVEEEIAREVCKTIQATARKSNPENILEEIIRDADSSHFSKASYLDTCELLRQELANLGIVNYTIDEWRKENIKMLGTEHRYYTNYAQENWTPKKLKNIAKLAKTEKKEELKEKKEELKVKLKNESPERGIQTLYRVTLRNHIKLSDIADTKANILLSVNAIIISLAMANLIPKLDSFTHRHLVLPSLILILFSVASIIFAIMSTRPNVTSGEFTEEDVAKRRVNLLFFGNFHKMPFDKYEKALDEMIRDKQYIYHSLTKDLYYLGIVLARKYKLLRTTYTIFMIGIIISVIAYIIAFVLL